MNDVVRHVLDVSLYCCLLLMFITLYYALTFEGILVMVLQIIFI